MTYKQMCLIAVMLGIIIGNLFGTIMCERSYRKQAIEHGAAHYDKVTGNWEWNR